MKQNQSVNRLRKSLLAGIASVSLVAVGCGGGSGTVAPSTTPLLSIFKDGTAAVEVYDVTGGTATSGSRVTTGTLSAGALSLASQSAVTNAAGTWYFVRAQSGQGRVGVFMTGTELVNGGPVAHLNFSSARVAATYQLVDLSPNYSINDLNPAGAVLAVPSLTSAEKDFLTTATSSAFTGNAVLGGYSFAINQVANGTNRYVATTSATQVPFDAVVEGIVQGQSIAYVGVTEDPTGAIANGSASIGTVSDVRFATATLTGTTGAFADAARLRAARLATSALFRIFNNRAVAPAAGINSLIAATLSIPNTADATKVADIAGVVADSVELVANAGGAAATDLLTSVLANVNANPSTLVSNQATIVSSVETNLSAVVDAVASNTVNASNSAQFLGSLAGTLMANNRAATNAAVAKVVSLADANILPDNVAAQRLVGAILEASARLIVAQANFFQAISNVATSRGTNLGTLISDSVATISSRGNINAADLYTNTVTALQSSAVTQVVANASSVVSSLVDAALSNSSVVASGLQSVLTAAGQGTTPKLQVAIAGDSSVNLKKSESAQTLTFRNLSKAANLTPSYVWSVTPTTSPVASFTNTTAAGTFSVTFAANATGTATVTLNGSGSGLSGLASVTVNVADTIPVDGEISGPSVVTSGVPFVVTYSIYDAEATESAVVTISGATSQTWTTAELKSGAKKTATVTLNTLGNQSVSVTYKNAAVTSLKVNVRDHVYALSLAQIGTGSEVTIANTTGDLSIVSTLIDADPVAGSSTYALSILPVTGTCGNSVGALAVLTGTSGAGALTVTATVTAGNSYLYCASVSRTGKTTQSIDKVFSVRQADAAVINSVSFNGVLATLGGSVSMTATNTSIVNPVVSVNVTGTATAAMISFGQTTVNLTTGTGNLTATLSNLAPGTNLAEVTVVSNTGRTTKFPFAFTVTRMDVVTVTGFQLNTVALGMGSVSNMTLPLSTNAATVNNNNVTLGVTFDAASANSAGIDGGLTIKLSDVVASTGVAATNGATAELTVSGVRLVNTAGTWTVAAINGTNFQLSASAVGRGGSPSGSGMSTENAATLSNYFSGTATNLNINLAALRDRLGTLSNLSGLNQITTLTGQNIKVEVTFSYGSSQEMLAAGSKFDKAVVNGVTVQ